MMSKRPTKTHATSAAKKGKGDASSELNSKPLNRNFESDDSPRPKRRCAPQNFTPEYPIDPPTRKPSKFEKDPKWTPDIWGDLLIGYKERNTKTKTKESTAICNPSRNGLPISSRPLTRPSDAPRLLSSLDGPVARKRKHNDDAEAMARSKKRRASPLTEDESFDPQSSAVGDENLEVMAVQTNTIPKTVQSISECGPQTETRLTDLSNNGHELGAGIDNIKAPLGKHKQNSGDYENLDGLVVESDPGIVLLKERYAEIETTVSAHKTKISDLEQTIVKLPTLAQAQKEYKAIKASIQNQEFLMLQNLGSLSEGDAMLKTDLEKQLGDQKSEAKKKFGELEMKISNHATLLGTICQEVNLLAARVNSITTEVEGSARKSVIDNITEDLTRLKDDMKDLQDLTSHYSALKHAVERLDADIPPEKFSSICKDIERLKSQPKELKEMASSVAEAVVKRATEGLQSKLSSAEQSLDLQMLRTMVEKIDQGMEAYKDRIIVLEKSVSTLQADIKMGPVESTASMKTQMLSSNDSKNYASVSDANINKVVGELRYNFDTERSERSDMKMQVTNLLRKMDNLKENVPEIVKHTADELVSGLQTQITTGQTSAEEQLEKLRADLTTDFTKAIELLDTHLNSRIVATINHMTRMTTQKTGKISGDQTNKIDAFGDVAHNRSNDFSMLIEPPQHTVDQNTDQLEHTPISPQTAQRMPPQSSPTVMDRPLLISNQHDSAACLTVMPPFIQNHSHTSTSTTTQGLTLGEQIRRTKEYWHFLMQQAANQSKDNPQSSMQQQSRNQQMPHEIFHIQIPQQVGPDGRHVGSAQAQLQAQLRSQPQAPNQYQTSNRQQQQNQQQFIEQQQLLQRLHLQKQQQQYKQQGQRPFDPNQRASIPSPSAPNQADPQEQPQPHHQQNSNTSPAQQEQARLPPAEQRHMKPQSHPQQHNSMLGQFMLRSLPPRPNSIDLLQSSGQLVQAQQTDHDRSPYGPAPNLHAAQSSNSGR